MSRGRRISRTRRVILFWTAAALIAAVEAVLTAGWLVGRTSARIYSSVNDIPAREVGMVLGAPPYSGSRFNPVLAGRLQAAAELYHAGKVLSEKQIAALERMAAKYNLKPV